MQFLALAKSAGTTKNPWCLFAVVASLPYFLQWFTIFKVSSLICKKREQKNGIGYFIIRDEMDIWLWSFPTIKCWSPCGVENDMVGRKKGSCAEKKPLWHHHHLHLGIKRKASPVYFDRWWENRKNENRKKLQKSNLNLIFPQVVFWRSFLIVDLVVLRSLYSF